MSDTYLWYTVNRCEITFGFSLYTMPLPIALVTYFRRETLDIREVIPLQRCQNWRQWTWFLFYFLSFFLIFYWKSIRQRRQSVMLSQVTWHSHRSHMLMWYKKGYRRFWNKMKSYNMVIACWPYRWSIVFRIG